MNKDLIVKLIETKREGPYWDFKEFPHSNTSDLLHDIICMSNSIYPNDKYIIFGVTDSKTGCKIKGLSPNQKDRKTQSNYIDFIRSQKFAAENRPEIELHTIIIDSVEIDVLIVFDRPLKPYYLIKDTAGVKAYYIYSRIGDTNTPKDKSADILNIEKMWRQRFGIDVPPSEKYKVILDDNNGWNIDIGNKDTAYYINFPEYQIEFSETREGREVYSYFFNDPKSFFGTALFKYLSTTLFELEYGFLNEYRIPIAVPDIEKLELEGITYWYYYYEKDSMKYKLLKLIGLQAVLYSRKKEYLPFIFFNSSLERTIFIQYLNTIKNITKKIKSDTECSYIIEDMKVDGNNSRISAQFIHFIVNEYYKWSGH